GSPMPTEPRWTERLAARLPEAPRGRLLGTDAIVAEVAEKAELHRTTGALAVDMESHVVADVARRYGLPFAAVRVVCDPAHRALPPAGRLCVKPGGRMDLAGAMRVLLAGPGR